jgi:hypothetical protein
MISNQNAWKRKWKCSAIHTISSINDLRNYADNNCFRLFFFFQHHFLIKTTLIEKWTPPVMISHISPLFTSRKKTLCLRNLIIHWSFLKMKSNQLEFVENTKFIIWFLTIFEIDWQYQTNQFFFFWIKVFLQLKLCGK